MLVMRFAAAALSFVALAASTAVFAQVGEPNLYPDPGAGPLRISTNACLLANRTHRGPPCPEPQIAPNADKAGQARGHMARAQYFIDMQELEIARDEVSAARALVPKDASTVHFAARIALSLHDVKAAEADLKAARQLAPDDPNIQATWAFFLQSKQADAESFEAFNVILKKHPDHRFAREQRAALLMQFQRPQAALADFEVLLKTSPPDIGLLTQRAEALVAVGRAADATKDYSAALMLSPHRQDLMVALADAYVAAGSDEGAIGQLDKILSMQDGVPVYPMFENERAKLLTKRAHALVRLERLDEAARDAVAAAALGGRPAVLRAQIELRRNGFPNLPLDGQVSPALSKALSLCFGLKVCFQAISKAI